MKILTIVMWMISFTEVPNWPKDCYSHDYEHSNVVCLRKAGPYPPKNMGWQFEKPSDEEIEKDKKMYAGFYNVKVSSKTVDITIVEEKQTKKIPSACLLALAGCLEPNANFADCREQLEDGCP